MAASTSREPHDIPLPPSSPPSNKKKERQPSKMGKGKLKERPAGKRVNNPPGQRMSEVSSSDLPWDWIALTEKLGNRTAPVFTLDGSYFFSVVGSSVKIHSSATGNVVSTLLYSSIEGSSAEHVLTSAIINPHNPFQLITGSTDGYIRIWDYMDATLLSTIEIGSPVLHICAHKQIENHVCIVVARPSVGKQDNASVFQISLTPPDGASRLSFKPDSFLQIGKTRSCTGLSFSPSGRYLVATANHKVYVATSSDLKTGFTKYVSPERLTCLSFHPSEDYFATGDDKGVVRLWYCLHNPPVKAFGVEKRTQTSALHWHAHAISSLSFTSNGAYLLSGGEEAVLVVWQLHTGKKEFVPRVGAPIQTISVMNSSDREEYLLVLSDATLMFVDASTLKMSRSFSQIKLDPITSYGKTHIKPHHTPIDVHKLSSTFILPSSHTSSLQIYSPSTSRLIMELEVSPSNRISRTDEKPIEQACVQQVTVSRSGLWMATIDTREGDKSFAGEIFLKIWQWDSSKQWRLNTRIDQPHGNHNVVHASFSPDSSSLVTSGEDLTIKAWTLRSSKDGSDDYWILRSSISRLEIPRNMSWSEDGSLLAVALGSSVALYDPMSNRLCQTIALPECKVARSCHFVGRGARYLAIYDEHDLVTWDLLSQSVRWHHRFSRSIMGLYCHSRSDSFAIFHQDRVFGELKTCISIFSPSSTKCSRRLSVPFRLVGVAPYYPGTSSSSFLFVGIRDSWGVVMFGDNVQAFDQAPESTKLSQLSGPTKRTVFQDIFGKSAFSDEALHHSSKGSTAVFADKPPSPEVFDRPSYLVPSLDGLFDPLMEDFLIRRETDTHYHNVTELDSMDVEDVEEEETEVVRTDAKIETDQQTLRDLATLFKKHTLQGMSESTAINSRKSPTKANGVHPKVNGSMPLSPNTPKAVNGENISKLKASISKGSPIMTSPSTSPMTTNGKKRKIA